MATVQACLDGPAWERLTPSERDAIRLQLLNFIPPVDAGRWPETRWAWDMLLQRFSDVRRIEETWTGVPQPMGAAELTAHAAFKRWLYGPEKKYRFRRKFVLTELSGWFKDVFRRLFIPSNNLLPPSRVKS